MIDRAVTQDQALPLVNRQYVVARYGIYALMALHIPLAIAAEFSATVSTLHALGTVAISLILALRTRRLEVLALALAYIMGSEVLWRITRAGVLWEFGKYASAALMVTLLLRLRLTKIPALFLIYFLPLLPSVLITFNDMPLSTAAQLVSGNLSGPLALMVAGWYFTYVRLDLVTLRRILLTFLIPLVGMAALSTFFVLTRPNIHFGLESVTEVTGGYNPNQVSSLFGLGVLAIWLLFLYVKMDRLHRVILLGLGLWFVIISLLTFSRSGIFSSLIPVALVTIHSLSRREIRARSLVLVIISLLAFVYVLFPQLEAFTRGAFSSRFTDPTPTNRDTFIFEELQMFYDNALLGVGAGMSPYFRGHVYAILVGSHTEYSRALAEHGLLGLISVLALGALCWRNFQRTAGSYTWRGIILALLSWALVFMLHAATRIVAPSILIGLTCATLVENSRDQRFPAPPVFPGPYAGPQPWLHHHPGADRR